MICLKAIERDSGDKLLSILIDLLSGGAFFKYPLLIPIAIAVVTLIFTFSFYRWKYPPASGFCPWRPVLAASVSVAFVLSIAFFLFHRYWGLPATFTDDQIGILVAEVPDQTNREQQQAYQNALHLCVQKNQELQEVVKVRLLLRPLPPDAEAQQAEAVKIGRWLRAAFILRPFVVEGVQQPWLTVVNPQNIFLPESSLGKFPNSQLAALDALPLPGELAQLAETALALALIEHHSYKEAAQLLGDVLRSEHLAEASPSRWALYFERGYGLILSGNKAEAVTEFKEALRLKPDFAEAHNNLGTALDASRPARRRHRRV